MGVLRLLSDFPTSAFRTGPSKAQNGLIPRLFCASDFIIIRINGDLDRRFCEHSSSVRFEGNRLAFSPQYKPIAVDPEEGEVIRYGTHVA